jgi:hypothetical protein
MLHIFWDVTSCRVEDIYCFRRTYWLHVYGRRISHTGKKFQYIRARGNRTRDCV